jgi:hypothetical protein
MKYYQITKILREELESPYADIFVSNGDIFRSLPVSSFKIMDVSGPGSKEPDTLKSGQTFISLENIVAIVGVDKNDGLQNKV